MRSSKYHAKKVMDSTGNVFDSKAELKRWNELKLMEMNGEITSLTRQVTFHLLPKQELLRPRQNGNRTEKSERKVDYIADFVYFRRGIMVVEDVKGICTPEYTLKRKLMLYIHGIQIDEIRR